MEKVVINGKYLFAYVAIYLSSILCAWGQQQTKPEDGATLLVTVQKIKKAEGQIVICLSDSPDQFLKDCLKSKIVEIKENGDMQLLFHQLAKGKYAISMFQDLNKNKILDKNFLGIPKEPYAFSNNPKLLFGPPDFSKCAFSVSSSNKEIHINMR